MTSLEYFTDYGGHTDIDGALHPWGAARDRWCPPEVYFNSEDDCWWHPDLRGVGFFADTMVKEIDLGGLSAYQFTYD